MKIFENLKNLFDSAQCQTAQSLTPCSVSQFRISNISIVDSAKWQPSQSKTFREYLRENEFLSKIILVCLLQESHGTVYLKCLMDSVNALVWKKSETYKFFASCTTYILYIVEQLNSPNCFFFFFLKGSVSRYFRPPFFS